jgi:hypothetical protein
MKSPLPQFANQAVRVMCTPVEVNSDGATLTPATLVPTRSVIPSTTINRRQQWSKFVHIEIIHAQWMIASTNAFAPATTPLTQIA